MGVHSGKLTWQKKVDPLKMYSLLKMGIFHCYVSLPEGISMDTGIIRFYFHDHQGGPFGGIELDALLFGNFDQGGGNSMIFYFHPENWGRFPFWLIFFRWVETTNQWCICPPKWSFWVGNMMTFMAQSRYGRLDLPEKSNISHLWNSKIIDSNVFQEGIC